MTLGVYSETRYIVMIKNKKGTYIKERVTGFQVGRFAFRRVLEDTEPIGSSIQLEVPFYAIDHIPTGFSVLNVRTVEDAGRLVDDLSRFSKEDPSSRDVEKVKAQLGPDILRWLTAQRERVELGHDVWGFREHAGHFSR